MLMQQEVSLKFFHDGEARPQCRLLWQTVYIYTLRYKWQDLYARNVTEHIKELLSFGFS